MLYQGPPPPWGTAGEGVTTWWDCTQLRRAFSAPSTWRCAPTQESQVTQCLGSWENGQLLPYLSRRVISSLSILSHLIQTCSFFSSSWVVSPRSHGVQTFVLEQWTFVQSKSYLRVPGSTVWKTGMWGKPSFSAFPDRTPWVAALPFGGRGPGTGIGETQGCFPSGGLESQPQHFLHQAAHPESKA